MDTDKKIRNVCSDLERVSNKKSIPTFILKNLDRTHGLQKLAIAENRHVTF